MTTAVDASERRLASVTWLALAFAAIGVAGALASGIGLPFALAGSVCGVLAIRRAPADRGWAVTALVVSVLTAIACAILLAIAASIWLGR